jgi:hypothetical protein
LVGIEDLEVVVVTPEGTEPPPLPTDLGARHARYASEAARSELMRALAQWCGTHHRPWPILLYCAEGAVRGVSSGAIVGKRVGALR